MMLRLHNEDRKLPRIGTLRRAARAIGALLARVAPPAARPEEKHWTETLRFPPF